MERPLCPLCKTNHFAREPHVFKKDGPGVRYDKGGLVVGIGNQAGDSPAPKPMGVSKEVGVSEKQGNPDQSKEAPKFDRGAYQREYMRAYRKRKNAQQKGS
jgi:hypothetical protein